MLANVLRWCQRVGNGTAFDAVGTTVCTASLLWIVWFYAQAHDPRSATLAAMLAAAVSGRNWYRVGKQRGAAVSWERKETG